MQAHGPAALQAARRPLTACQSATQAGSPRPLSRRRASAGEASPTPHAAASPAAELRAAPTTWAPRAPRAPLQLSDDGLPALAEAPEAPGPPETAALGATSSTRQRPVQHVKAHWPDVCSENPLRRALGVDFGRTKTGTAVSAGGLAPRPGPVLRFHGQAAELLTALVALAVTERTPELVVGVPRATVAGGALRRTSQTKHCEQFAERLADAAAPSGLRVWLSDENESSNMARALLEDSGAGVVRAREQLDSVAAAVILERAFAAAAGDARRAQLPKHVLPAKGVSVAPRPCWEASEGRARKPVVMVKPSRPPPPPPAATRLVSAAVLRRERGGAAARMAAAWGELAMDDGT